MVEHWSIILPGTVARLRNDDRYIAAEASLTRAGSLIAGSYIASCFFLTNASESSLRSLSVTGSGTSHESTCRIPFGKSANSWYFSNAAS